MEIGTRNGPSGSGTTAASADRRRTAAAFGTAGRRRAFGRTGSGATWTARIIPARHELLRRGNHPRRRPPRLARRRRSRTPSRASTGPRRTAPTRFELDVRLTLDGEAVVFHDLEIVLGDRRVPVATGHDARAQRDPDRPRRVPGSRPDAPRGLRALRLPGRYLVELKPGPSPRPGLLEFRVAALLSQLALLEKAVVLSFSPDMLRRIKEIEPRVETCLNFDGTAYRPDRAALARPAQRLRGHRPERGARRRTRSWPRRRPKASPSTSGR